MKLFAMIHAHSRTLIKPTAQLLLVACSVLAGQASAVTPQQIEQFKSLSPGQQAALARQYGIDPAAVQGLNGQGMNGQRKSLPTLEQPQVVVPMDPYAQQAGPRNGYTQRDNEQLDPSQYQEGLAQDSSARVGAALNKPLQAFGYSLFAGSPTTFAPVTEIPIPTDYVLGPGDSIRLQMFGKENQQHELQVSRNGTIQLPQSGPMPVAGLSFDEVKQQLTRWVREKYIGVDAAVSLGELRSMQVFILGEARTPGAYTVSSLSTMTNALFVSGGVKQTGSLRKVQLKRQGKQIAELDLYDLLLRGDTSDDRRLMPGDVIFIPPVGTTAAIEGEIRRPAIYELKSETTARELVQLAGGFLPEAHPRETKVQRVAKDFKRTVVDVDLSSDTGAAFSIKNGDHLSVGSVNDLVEGFVAIEGAVVRPGNYDWQPRSRVSTLLRSIRHDLRESADLNYALIVREINARKEIDVIAFDLGVALTNPGTAADLMLADRDQIIVFERYVSREEQLEPVLERLAHQARAGQPAKIVQVNGAVKLPGSYPLTRGATATDMIKAAGGLKDSSYTVTAEISRANTSNPDLASVDIFNVDLAQAFTNASLDVAMQGRDVLTIKQIPDYAERLTVTLAGEVKFPGEYVVKKGDTLSQLIARAGGLTANAFPRGAVFTRERLKQLEAQRLKEAGERLQADLTAMELQDNEEKAKVEDVQQLKGLLEKVQTSRPLGRLVIDVERLVAEAKQDVILQNGDMLMIPPTPQSVSVIGEVQYATSHIYEPDLSVEEYIEHSGGITRKADDDKIYVVKANGSVWLPEKSSWFGSRSIALEPGDTIVVPLEVDRLNKLQLWTNVSQVFYQIALGAAAVGSL